jgi:hypothetical protein
MTRNKHRSEDVPDILNSIDTRLDAIEDRIAEVRDRMPTLRDWFAGQALVMFATANVNGLVAAVGTSEWEANAEFTARVSYALADAMLAARDKKVTP